MMVNSSSKRKTSKQRIRETKRIYSDGAKNEYMGVEKRDRERKKSLRNC